MRDDTGTSWVHGEEPEGQAAQHSPVLTKSPAMQGLGMQYQAHSLLSRSLQTSLPWMPREQEVLMLQGPQASYFMQDGTQSPSDDPRGINGPASLPFLSQLPPASPSLIPVQPPCPYFCSTSTLSSVIPQGL